MRKTKKVTFFIILNKVVLVILYVIEQKMTANDLIEENLIKIISKV